MTSLFPFQPVAIVLLIMTVISACGADQTPANENAVGTQQEMPADSNTLAAQQKMYLSFEITLRGERKFEERVPADALADVSWRLDRSVKGEITLDMPLPGAFPQSSAPDDQTDLLAEGRYMGWMPAVPNDPAFLEQVMAGKLDISRNPTYVPVEFRIDDEVHGRSRDFPSEPFGTTHDQTIKGRGKAYTNNDGMVACDLKMMVCDISGILGDYTDGTDLLTIAEMSSYPGDQGKSRTMGPDLMLPRISEALGKRLTGIKFKASGPISTSFSEPYRDTYLLNIPAGAEDLAPIVTVNVTVSPRPALDTSKPQ
jgi:hypothetical protein